MTTDRFYSTNYDEGGAWFWGIWDNETGKDYDYREHEEFLNEIVKLLNNLEDEITELKEIISGLEEKLKQQTNMTFKFTIQEGGPWSLCTCNFLKSQKAIITYFGKAFHSIYFDDGAVWDQQNGYR